SGMILGLASAWLLVSPMCAPASEGPARSRTFELTYKATVRDIPGGTKGLDLWLPLPQADRNQSIHQVVIDAPSPVSIGPQARFGNQRLHVRVDHPKAPVAVTLTVKATRREDAGGDEPLGHEERAEYLKAEPLVPLDGPVLALALEATRGLETDAER